MYPYPRQGRCIAPDPWSHGKCGKPYEDYTGRRKFCSDKCRAAAHREKHRPARVVAALRQKLDQTRKQVVALERALERAIAKL